jgi:TM2 domain-containing membrane protein YozV
VKKPIKAALISALVFPGAGHLYLKRYAMGALLTVVSVITLYILVSTAIAVALKVIDKLVTSNIPPDLNSVMNLVSPQAHSTELSTSVATTVLFVAWIIGIVDSYRLGLVQERANLNA